MTTSSKGTINLNIVRVPPWIQFLDIYHSTETENNRSLRSLGIIAAESGHATNRYTQNVREDIEINKRHVGAAVVKIKEAKMTRSVRADHIGTGRAGHGWQTSTPYITARAFPVFQRRCGER